MIDIGCRVYAALKKVLPEDNVFFSFPPKGASFPCISFYEINNSPYSASDNREYASEINYQVDVWGSDISGVVKKTDKALMKIGFVREFACDLYDERNSVYRKTMRYRIIKGDV